MIVIAHAGHWALGLVEAAPVFVVAAFALWRSLGERGGRQAAPPAAGR
jgi:hypothetical protein